MGYLDMHANLCNSNTPNCLFPQMNIPTNLNIPLWENLLHKYRDHQLVYYLKYGFPLDLNKSLEFHPTTRIDNHKTAQAHPRSVIKYLDTETKLGAILGPFKNPPIQDLHCSPMLTRPKQGTDNRRVIVDLSWPHGNSINDSINDSTYMGTLFKLKFPSVDNITERIVKLKGNCLLYKIDLQRAFRHLKLDPRDINSTGLQFENQYYVDTAIPFGYRHGSACMQRLTDSLRWIMHKKGFFVMNYIDDLIGCDEPSLAIQGFEYLKSLIPKLGLTISSSKLYVPQNSIPCLGIDVDISSGVISIPSEKLEEIVQTCQAWQNKVKTHKRALQSLVGSLLYIHKCVRPARLFVNRILATLREAPDSGAVRLDRNFLKDIAWFNQFLPHFNGRVYFNKDNQNPVTSMYVDACLTGLGGYWNDLIYAYPVSHIPALPLNHSIVHLEMVNVYVALKVWKSKLRGQTVIINCDNFAVVSTLNSGKALDNFLLTVARNVWMLTAIYDIELQVVHIPGKINVKADILSRWFNNIDRYLAAKQFSSCTWCQIDQSDIVLDYNI